MDGRRPIWQSGLLHAVLIGGSIAFLLPYLWLLGTSWKLDKEVQSDALSLFPRKPVPQAVSPYIDDGTYRPIERPEGVPHDRWEGWQRRAVEEEIRSAVFAWSDPRADVALAHRGQRTIAKGPGATSNASPAVPTELAEGVFKQLRSLLAAEAWSSADEPTFRQTVRAAITPQLINDVFGQCYRYFAIGRVIMKDRQYRIHDLTAGRPVTQLWTVERGRVTIEPRVVDEREIAVLHYDFTPADAFELSAKLSLPVPFDEFKRLDLGLRRDESWHELRIQIEAGGRLLRSDSPKYLGEDTGLEVSFQEPSPDDDAPTPHRYILLKEIGRGPRFDHGPDAMVLRVQVAASSRPEAYWAKGTENYRRVFDEVPFWRYFGTSVFLAIVNILGTCFSCSIAAYALARLQWPGRNLCFILVLATLMIPPQVTMIPSFVIYRQLGWYNTLAPLWVPACLAINAFAIFLLRQAMMGIPRDLEDAAKIDGCGYWRTYWNVALPLMRPTLAAISVFTFMYVWNDFMGPLIYVNDQRLYPLALGLFSFMAGRENQFTLIMAGATVMTVPVVVVFFVLQRYFIQGVTLTGIKG